MAEAEPTMPAGQPASDDAKHAGPRHFWSPFSATMIGGAIFLGAQLLASVPIIAYPMLRGWGSRQASDWSSGTYAQFWYVLGAEGLTFWAIWWFTKRGGLNLRKLGWRGWSWWMPVYALCGLAVYFAIYLSLLGVSSWLVPSLNLKAQQDIGFNQVHGAAQLIVTFLSLVVLPPVVEETLFRGFLFTAFRRRLRFVASALLVSALFAVPHLLESQQPGSLLWVAGIDTFTLSLVLCYLREKTGSLWAGVVLHALKNLIAFLALYVLAVR